MNDRYIKRLVKIYERAVIITVKDEITFYQLDEDYRVN